MFQLNKMVSTEVLHGTIFYWLYTLFGVSTDEELMYRMTLSAIIYTLFVGFASVFIPAPYGKHSSSQTRFTLNATASWIVSYFAFVENCSMIYCVTRYKRLQDWLFLSY